MKNPYSRKAKYRHRRFKSPSAFDPRSFRTIRIGRQGRKLVVACPKGKWRKGRCSVGMQRQKMLTPKRKYRRGGYMKTVKFRTSGGKWRTGKLLASDGISSHKVKTKSGAIVWVKEGHGDDIKMEGYKSFMRRRNGYSRKAKRIRFGGHLWTRAKFAKKYGKRKAAKCFSKRRRKYARRRARNFIEPGPMSERQFRKLMYSFGHSKKAIRRILKRARREERKKIKYQRKLRSRHRNGAYPYFTVIKGGGKRRRYRRPKLRLIIGGKRRKAVKNRCR